MKAHHGCCQVIFDHNLKTQPAKARPLASSVPSNPSSRQGTPRLSSSTTPREPVADSESDLFGHPQGHQDVGMRHFALTTLELVHYYNIMVL